MERNVFEMADLGFNVSLNKMIEEFELEKIYETKDIDNIVKITADVNLQGLQMTIFYDYFYFISKHIHIMILNLILIIIFN